MHTTARRGAGLRASLSRVRQAIAVAVEQAGSGGREMHAPRACEPGRLRRSVGAPGATTATSERESRRCRTQRGRDGYRGGNLSRGYRERRSARAVADRALFDPRIRNAGQTPPGCRFECPRGGRPPAFSTLDRVEAAPPILFGPPRVPSPLVLAIGEKPRRLSSPSARLGRTLKKIYPDKSKKNQSPAFDKSEIVGVFNPTSATGPVGPGATTLRRWIIVR